MTNGGLPRLSQLFGLDGKTALVTGARSGIGRAAAGALAAAGADVILWGHTAAGMERAAAEVRLQGVEARVVVGDLGDLADVERVAGEVLVSAEVDVLVNNAGVILRGPAASTGLDDWRQVLTVNLDAMFVLCRCFGIPMTERGTGSIVNVASVLSFQGGWNVAAYAASKHGVAGLTKALANEWAPFGVNVNAVAPGYVVTDNTRALLDDPEREAAIRARIPAGRWGEPDEIAGAVVFLASDAGRYVHGHVLVVDGGWLAR